jgi:hypothetical protein
VVDIERLELAMKQIETEPELHHQAAWACRVTVDGVCQTAFCLAGWGAIQAGVAAPNVPADVLNISWYIDPETLESFNHHRPGYRTIHEWARQYFGLMEDQADDLFNGLNTRADLRHMVDQLTHDPDARLQSRHPERPQCPDTRSTDD